MCGTLNDKLKTAFYFKNIASFSIDQVIKHHHFITKTTRHFIISKKKFAQNYANKTPIQSTSFFFFKKSAFSKTRYIANEKKILTSTNGALKLPIQLVGAIKWSHDVSPQIRASFISKQECQNNNKPFEGSP